MSIEIKNLSKKFGEFEALKPTNLTVQTGELLALLGPSGSGKTTLLRMIAGLEQPDSGSVLFSGEDTSNLAVKDRQVGFVFQHYALFKHLTVFENIAFGLRVKPRKSRPSAAVIQEKVDTLLHLVQLDKMGHRYPSQLSGGQRQRVALARALAIEPRVLLLDEPFGALDAKVRKELRQWLRRLHDQLHVTSVFVTHDVEEALEVADRVVVMRNGGIEQIGTPDEIYHHPANAFVFEFIGQVNTLKGRVEGDHIHFGSGSSVMYVRPHLLDIHQHASSTQDFEATIRHILLVGPNVKVELENAHNETFHVELSRARYEELCIKTNDVVFISLKENPKVFQDYSI